MANQGGDQVLDGVFVQCIRALLETTCDWVARYGGEEFIITPYKNRCKRWHKTLAERIRKAMTNRVIYRREGNPITASFGVTGFDASTLQNRFPRKD